VSADGVAGAAMTDTEIIEIVRAHHLRANIGDPVYRHPRWHEAWVDPGGGIFGPGPYVHLPIDLLVSRAGEATERVVIRVYPDARGRRLLRRRST